MANPFSSSSNPFGQGTNPFLEEAEDHTSEQPLSLMDRLSHHGGQFISGILDVGGKAVSGTANLAVEGAENLSNLSGTIAEKFGADTQEDVDYRVEDSPLSLINDAGKAISGAGAAVSEELSEESLKGTLGSDLSSGAGQLVGLLATGGIAKKGAKKLLGKTDEAANALAGGTALGVGATSQAQSMYEQAIEKGASKDDAENMLFAGAAIGSLDALLPDEVFRAASAVRPSFAKKLKEVAGAAALEGGTEVIQGTASKIALNEVVDPSEVQELIDSGTIREGQVGAILGAVVRAAVPGKKVTFNPEEQAFNVESETSSEAQQESAEVPGVREPESQEQPVLDETFTAAYESLDSVPQGEQTPADETTLDPTETPPLEEASPILPSEESGSTTPSFEESFTELEKVEQLQARALEVREERAAEKVIKSDRQLRVEQAKQQRKENSEVAEAAIAERNLTPKMNKVRKVFNRYFTSEKGAGAFSSSDSKFQSERSPLATKQQEFKGQVASSQVDFSITKRELDSLVNHGAVEYNSKDREAMVQFMENSGTLPENVKANQPLAKLLEEKKGIIDTQDKILRAKGIIPEQSGDPQGDIVGALDEDTRVGYVHREYEMFAAPGDAKRWVEHVKATRPEVYQELKDWQQTEDGSDYLGSADQENWSLDGALVELASRSKSWGQGGSGSLLREDTSATKKRKSIPAPVRRFWGEVRDPVQAIAQTEAAQSQLLLQRKFQEDLVQSVVESGEAGYGTNKAEQQWVKLKDNAPETHPFKDLYVSPDLYRVLKDPDGRAEAGADATDDSTLTDTKFGAFNQAVDGGSLLGTINTLGKANLVIYNPGSHAKNAASVVFLSAANGTRARDILSATKLSGLVARHRDSIANPAKARESGKDQFSEQELQQVREVLEANLIDESVLGEESLQNFRRVVGESMNTDPSATQKTVEGYKKVTEKIGAAFQRPDSIGRIAAYLTNKNVLERSKFGSDIQDPVERQQAINREAAMRARNTYPTYSNVPLSVSQLSNKPVGAFFSWTMESARTYIQNYRIAATDMASGDKALVAHGAKRMAMNALVPTTLAAVTASAFQDMVNELGFGADEGEYDEEEAKKLRAPWMLDHQVVHFKDEKGDIREIDVTSTLPFAIQEVLIKAASDLLSDGATDEELDETLTNIYNEFGSSVLGENIGFSAVKAGQSLFTAGIESAAGNSAEAETQAKQAAKDLKRFLPGVLRTLGDFKEGDIVKGMTRALGATAQKRDLGTQAFFKTKEFNQHRNNNRKDVLEKLDVATTDEELTKVLEDYYRAELSFQEDHREVGVALTRQGMSGKEATERMGKMTSRIPGIGKTASGKILRGSPVIKDLNIDYKDWTPQKKRKVAKITAQIRREARRNK